MIYGDAVSGCQGARVPVDVRADHPVRGCIDYRAVSALVPRLAAELLTPSFVKRGWLV